MTRQTPVLLMGGIGNQLFQVARAVDLASTGRRPVLVEVEQVLGLGLITRKLMNWSIHPDWLGLPDLVDRLKLAYRQPTVQEQARILAELAHIKLVQRPNRLNLPQTDDTRAAQIGYFQHAGCISPAAFGAIVEQLDQMIDRPPASPTHVMHVRGGDFAVSDRIGADQIGKFIERARGQAVCVTNDRAYVQAQFPDLRIHTSHSAREDFTAIARARHVLASNSTFCFWASAIATMTGQAKVELGTADPYWQLLSPTGAFDV